MAGWSQLFLSRITLETCRMFRDATHQLSAPRRFPVRHQDRTVMIRLRSESKSTFHQLLSAAGPCLLTASLLTAVAATSFAARPAPAPVVARIEMKLADDDQIVDVIEQGDLLTVIEEREDDYVIVTHDGTKGAVDKVNAVQIAESGDIYTDLIQRNPHEGRYYTLRAGSWWALGKAEKALDDFDRAIELGYEEAHAYTSRGLFHAAQGDYDRALADYDKAIELDPEDIAPRINRAAVLMSKKDPSSAAADYTAALKIAPGRDFPASATGHRVEGRRATRDGHQGLRRHSEEIS